MLLSIDPSSAAARVGWAIFDGRVLVTCGKGSPPAPWLTDVTEAIIEHPVIYPHGRTPNPNDVVKLAVTVGELAGVLSAHGLSVRYVEPRAWKGTLDKDTGCRRAWSRLQDHEQAVAAKFKPPASGKVPGSIEHTLDAIGIGLFAVGRWRL